MGEKRFKSKDYENQWGETSNGAERILRREVESYGLEPINW